MEIVDVGGSALPVLPGPAVARDRWGQRVAGRTPDLFKRRLTLLRAPAGYGKSTALSLLRERAERMSAGSAMLLLDRRDADLPRFLARVARALGIDAAPQSGFDLAELIDARPGVTLLFIDDLDAVCPGPVHEAISDLLLQAEKLRLVVATREAHLPGLAKLRAQDRVELIGPDELRFTREEALELLDQPVSADVLRLVDRCDGWPVLLKMAASGLDAGDTPAIAGELGSVSADLIADFLEEEILAPLTAAHRNFLVTTSLVSRFTIELARLLAPDARIEESIEHLTRRTGLLQSRRLNGLWFHTNDMLRAALLRRLHANIGSDVKQLHRAVEAWMIEHDAADEAVLHACLAHDYEECVSLIRRFGPAELSMRYGLRTFRSVLIAVPRHRLDREPALGVSEALILSKEGRTGDARRLVRRLRAVQESAPSAEGAMGDLDLLDIMLSCHADQPLPEDIATTLEQIAATMSPSNLIHQGWIQNLLCRVHLSTGSFTAAAAAGLAAERYYAKSDSRYGQFFIHLHLASTRSWQGLAEEAGMQLDAAESIAVHYFPEDPNMAALARLLRAELHFESGTHELGIDLLPALQCAENNDGWLDLFISGYRTAALHACGGGHPETALAIARRGEEAAMRTGLPRLGLIMQVLRVELLTFAGNRAQAAALSRGIRMPRADERMQWRERLFLGIANARLLIHSRQFKRASLLLDALEAECIGKGIGRPLMKVAILKSLLLSCSGSPQRAIAALIEVLQSNPPRSSLQSFLEEGELMARLCSLVAHSAQRHALSVEARQSLDTLSEALAQTYQHVIDQDAGGSCLSSREREILLCLAKGDSNKSTASRLNVSEATVKFHLQRIYRKLGAHNRVKALAVAQQQGLLY